MSHIEQTSYGAHKKQLQSKTCSIEAIDSFHVVLGKEFVVFQLWRLFLEKIGHRRCVLVLFVVFFLFFEIALNRILVQYRVGG